MGFRMKNFDILGVHGKVRVLQGGGGVSRETNISLGLPKKGIVCRFKGSLARKRGGLIPQMHTMNLFEKRLDLPRE